MADEINLTEQSANTFANVYQNQREADKVQMGALLDTYLSNLTFGTSAVVESQFVDDETGKNYLKFERDHPIQSALAAAAGLVTGTIATGFVPGVGEAQAPGRLAQAARIYRALQGVGKAETYGAAARMGITGGLAWGAGEALHQEALDPDFTKEALVSHAQSILESGGIGGVANTTLHGLGNLWNKWRGNKVEALKGVFDESANETASKGMFHDTNQLFVKQSFDKLDTLLTKLDNNIPLSDIENIDLAFYSDLKSNKEIYANVASSNIDIQKLYRDYIERHVAQEEFGQFGPGSVEAITNELTHNVADMHVIADHKLGAVYQKTEEGLEAQANSWFSNPLNNGILPNNISKDATQAGGRVDSINNVLRRAEKPGDFLTQEAGESNAAFAARKDAANLPDTRPKAGYVDNLKTYFKKFRLRVSDELQEVEEAESRSLLEELGLGEEHALLEELSTGNEIKAAKTPKPKPKGTGIYIAKEDLTPEMFYEALQEFRKEIDDYSYSLQKNIATVLNPQETRLWSAVKTNILDMIEDSDNFGAFGELARQKTALLSDLNTVRNNLYYNISDSDKLLPRAPKPSEGKYVQKANRRAGAIKDAWQNLNKVSEDQKDWRYVNAHVQGNIETAQNQLFGEKGVLTQLATLFPSKETSEATHEMARALGASKANAQKISALNNRNVNTIFGKGEIYSTNLATGPHGGVGSATRFRAMIRDYLMSTVNPADIRFGQGQMLGIALNEIQKLAGPLFGLDTQGAKHMKDIFYNLLENGAQLQKQQKTFVNTMRNVSSKLLNLGKEIGPAAVRTVITSYHQKLSESEYINPINTKFDKIAKNIINMQTNPSLYAERLHFSLNGLRTISPQIADLTEKKILEQIGMVTKIFPGILNKTSYKPNIALSEKARFLDNVDALTDPLKMLNMIGDGSISAEQLQIFKISSPDIWQKTLRQVAKDIFYKNPPEEAKSRAYGVFGINDIESEFGSLRLANEMIQEQMMAKRPKLPHIKTPHIKHTDLKSFTTPASLTPQGVNA